MPYADKSSMLFQNKPPSTLSSTTRVNIDPIKHAAIEVRWDEVNEECEGEGGTGNIIVNCKGIT